MARSRHDIAAALATGLLMTLAVVANAQPTGPKKPTTDGGLKQVLLEVHVFEVALDSDRQPGMGWLHEQLDIDQAGPKDPGAGPACFTNLKKPEIPRLLRTLQSQTFVRSLASPRLLVLEGQAAQVSLGQKVSQPNPNARGDDAEAITLGTDIKLSVRPRVTRGDLVILDCKPQVSRCQLDAKAGRPVVQHADVQTQMMLPSGQGVIVSGLAIDDETRATGRPVPGADKVFRGHTCKTRTEIAMIIVPQIVGTPTRAAGQRVAAPAAALPTARRSSLIRGAVQELASAARHLAAAQARLAAPERRPRGSRVPPRPAAVTGPSSQPDGPLVVLQAKLMELPVSKLEQRGAALEALEVKVLDSPEALGQLTAPHQDALKVLAEPTLVAVSGRKATFHSGGEFPILVPQSTGTVAVEYRQYGTRLDVVPQVMPDGRIRLQLTPTISEIDASEGAGVTVAGHKVPRLKIRRMSTAVEMKPGQTVLLRQPKQTSGPDGARRQTALIVAVTADLAPPTTQVRAQQPPVKR